jgi:hypothetical protein
VADAVLLARAQGLDAQEAEEAGEAILRFLKLERRQREAIATLMETLEETSDDE